MRRIIKDYQNNGKALEIRLEEETSTKYCVVIAGMTFNLKSGCANDRCEFTGEDEFMIIENETYIAHPFSSYRLANEAFEVLKKQYID